MKALFVSLMLATISVSFAQITVTQSSIQNGPSSFTWHMPLDVVTVDNGNGGANQSWSFMQATVQSQPVEIISPVGTPFAADFPLANRCQHSGPAGSGDYYYFQLTANALNSLGYGFGGSGLDPTVYEDPAFESPLPVTFGTGAWSRVWEYTTEPFPGFTMTIRDSSRRTVDGWGTVNTPYGSFQVIRSFSHSWNSTELTGIPPTITESVGYAYIDVNGNGVVANSAFDNTDPNFTEGNLSLMQYGTTSIDPVRGPVANSFSLEQNYPNPFNPTTHLPIQMEKSGTVSIRIYNELGELVSSESHTVNAGANTLPIDGSKWSTGTYFANVTANGQNLTQKMQLVK